MKNIKIILSLTLILGFTACQDQMPSIEYIPVPKTEIGKKLVASTDLFATISTDTSYVIADGARATEIKYVSMTGYSMKVFVFEIDLTNPNISIEASTPNNKNVFGLQRMTEQAKYEDSPGHKVFGGVNGDFFNLTTGTPQGILYKDSEPIKTTFQDAVCTYFAITKDKRAIVSGQADFSELKSSFKEAIGGRVTLIKDGIIVSQTDQALEPRTCIGVTEDNKKVYILAVDGRNFWYSNGMNYLELSKCMKALGAYNAINLDGGGSTTFFVRKTPGFENNRFEIRNWPTDNGGAERAVGDGLLIISKN